MRRPGLPPLLALGLALPLLVLAGCGKLGDLRPPEGEYEAYTWPKQYPAPRTVVPAEVTPEEPFIDPATGLPVTRGFRHPDALRGRDPSRTSTTIYRSQ